MRKRKRRSWRNRPRYGRFKKRRKIDKLSTKVKKIERIVKTAIEPKWNDWDLKTNSSVPTLPVSGTPYPISMELESIRPSVSSSDEWSIRTGNQIQLNSFLITGRFYQAVSGAIGAFRLVLVLDRDFDGPTLTAYNTVFEQSVIESPLISHPAYKGRYQIIWDKTFKLCDNTTSTVHHIKQYIPITGKKAKITYNNDTGNIGDIEHNNYILYLLYEGTGSALNCARLNLRSRWIDA